jgi:hypothetical protein
LCLCRKIKRDLYIIKITGGNFRLIQRLFSPIERIMEINRLEKITTEAIETARDILVLLDRTTKQNG